ncbi:MAG: hypothetical protein RIA71_06100 [Oceanicaulis sp.]
MSDPFESPKLLVRGAEEDQAEISSLASAFFSDFKASIFTEADAKTEDHVVYVAPPTPPEKLRRRAAEVLNSLRHSLDQAAYSASTQIGTKYENSTYFPFAADPNDFDQCLFNGKKARCRGIPESLRPYLRKLEPWWATKERPPTGNDLLRALGSSTGPNKHRAVLQTGIVSTSVNIRSMTMCSIRYPYRWHEDRRVLEIARTAQPDAMKIDMYIPMTLSFGNVRGIGGLPLEAIISDLIKMTKGIVNGIEAETNQLRNR